MKVKNDKPITGKEQEQILTIAAYFQKYPINYLLADGIKSKFRSDFGYDFERDKTRLNLLTAEVIRYRMLALAHENPGYQNFPVINHKSTTEAEPEDRVI